MVDDWALWWIQLVISHAFSSLLIQLWQLTFSTDSSNLIMQSGWKIIKFGVILKYLFIKGHKLDQIPLWSNENLALRIVNWCIFSSKSEEPKTSKLTRYDSEGRKIIYLVWQDFGLGKKEIVDHWITHFIPVAFLIILDTDLDYKWI